jgi:hypothetical protein
MTKSEFDLGGNEVDNGSEAYRKAVEAGGLPSLPSIPRGKMFDLDEAMFGGNK